MSVTYEVSAYVMVNVVYEDREKSAINSIAKAFNNKIVNALINEDAIIETLIINDVLIIDKRIVIARFAFLEIAFITIFF